MWKIYSNPDSQGSPISRLLRHTGGCEGPILIRILKGRHNRRLSLIWFIPLEIFLSYWNVIALLAFSSEGSCMYQRLLWHETSISKVISERPVIFISKCCSQLLPFCYEDYTNEKICKNKNCEIRYLSSSRRPCMIQYSKTNAEFYLHKSSLLSKMSENKTMDIMSMKPYAKFVKSQVPWPRIVHSCWRHHYCKRH
jgi:hypothetical protein